MPATIFFKNVLNPHHGGGLPIFPHKRGVALQAGDAFIASPISEGGMEWVEYHPGESFADLRKWVVTLFGDLDPVESDYQPGTAYKRVYRPLACSGNLNNAIDSEKRTQSFVALRILLNKLQSMFQAIEPTTQNLNAYGHLIREILLLACMEVETSLAAVLKENSYPASSPNRLSTNDYVKLRDVMLLDSYELLLYSYPGFPRFMPFDGWDSSAATRSLPWYDAYNKTKHDREGNLHLATLEHAIHAVGAATVVFYAQYGLAIGPNGYDSASAEIRSVFSVSVAPEKHWMSCYIPEFAIAPTGMLEVAPSHTWRLVDYPF